MDKLVFHERIGLEGRRISPFSWRIRYALAHKGLDPEVLPTRFSDVDRIRALSGQDLVPIVEHGGRVVYDSFAIACHLEDAFPDRPSLFGGAIGRAATRLVNHWSDGALNPPLRRVISADFVWCVDPGDRRHFRHTREQQFGMTLEEASGEAERRLAEFAQACAPIERTLGEQPFLAGEQPAYADYIVFSVLQWARIGSPREVLPAHGLDALSAWRTRMVGLYGGLGDRFAGYPRSRSGPDGR